MSEGEFLLGEWALKPTLSRTLNQREAATNTSYEIMETKQGTADYLNIEADRYDGRLALEHPKIGNFEGEIGIEGFDKDQTLGKFDVFDYHEKCRFCECCSSSRTVCPIQRQNEASFWISKHGRLYRMGAWI